MGKALMLRARWFCFWHSLFNFHVTLIETRSLVLWGWLIIPVKTTRVECFTCKRSFQ